jgi:uncharacterized protein
MVEPFAVHAAAGKREEENMRFRTFLKINADYDKLDEQCLKLHNELFAGYDCCKCNNCCRTYSISLQENEVDLIAAFLGLTKQDFSKKYLVHSVNGYEIKAPCCFLGANGECAIQECKPAECKEFPHTNKPDRLESLLGVVSSAEVCPVVFEILERLKEIYKFK